MEQQTRPPLPPFDEASAREKVKKAQDAWNTRDLEKAALAYTEDPLLGHAWLGARGRTGADLAVMP